MSVFVKLYLGDQKERFYGTPIERFEKLKDESEINSNPVNSDATISDISFADIESENENLKYFIHAERYWIESQNIHVIELTQDNYGKFVYVATKLEGGAYISAE